MARCKSRLRQVEVGQPYCRLVRRRRVLSPQGLGAPCSAIARRKVVGQVEAGTRMRVVGPVGAGMFGMGLSCCPWCWQGYGRT